MTDYNSLLTRFIDFKEKISSYYEYLINNFSKIQLSEITNFAANPLPKEMEVVRSSLIQSYGALAADIHGLAGYVTVPRGGQEINVFMLAFRFVEVSHYSSILWGLRSALACLDLAIGSCRYAISNEVEIKENQINIHQGAQLPGLKVIFNIFRSATKSLSILDRYVDEDLIVMLDTLPANLNIRILIKKEPYNQKPALILFFNKYRQTKGNIEIREVPQAAFHSRRIITDDDKVYELSFSIKDVGKTEGNIIKLEATPKASALTAFESTWKAGIAI